MSHRYGEKLPVRSQGPAKPSSPQISTVRSPGQEKDGPHATGPKQIDIDSTAECDSRAVTDAENSPARRTSDGAGTLLLPPLEEMESWTLVQLRAHLVDVVVSKLESTGQAREDLEARRTALIERVELVERAEEKRRDAARRVVIGRDVSAPPPDPTENTWRRRRFGPRSRRSGPVDEQLPKRAKRKKGGAEEEEEEKPDEELRSRRWKLKRNRSMATEETQEEAPEETPEWAIGDGTGRGTEDAEDQMSNALG